MFSLLGASVVALLVGLIILCLWPVQGYESEEKGFRYGAPSPDQEGDHHE